MFFCFTTVNVLRFFPDYGHFEQLICVFNFSRYIIIRDYTGEWCNLIDFESELSKFAPVEEIDDVEQSVKSDEFRDLLDLLNYILLSVKKKE